MSDKKKEIYFRSVHVYVTYAWKVLNFGKFGSRFHWQISTCFADSLSDRKLIVVIPTWVQVGVVFMVCIDRLIVDMGKG